MAGAQTKKRGGARTGAGAKPKTAGEPMHQHSMRWTDRQWEAALSIGLDRVRELVIQEAEKATSVHG